MLATEVCAGSDIWRNIGWDPCKYMVLDKTELKGLWGMRGTFLHLMPLWEQAFLL